MIYWTIAKWVGGVLLGLGLAWSIYAGIVRPTTKPTPTTSQKADSIINTYNYYQPRSTFGCASSRVWEYEHPTNKEVSVNGVLR